MTVQSPTSPIANKPAWRRRAAAAALSCALVGASVVPQQRTEAGCCGEVFVLAAILVAMEINFALLYAYMISGIGDVGTGIVGTITGNAQSKASHEENSAANNEAHFAQVKQKTDIDMIVAKRVIDEMPDQRACEAATLSAVSAGRGAGNAAAKKSAMQSAAAQKRAGSQSAGTQPSEAAHAAAVYEELTAYASQADVDAGRAEALSPDKLPDANIRAQSLFIPAHDYYNAAVAAEQNITFGEKQLEAAEAAMTNMVARFSPAALPKNVEGTPAGRMYVAKTKIYNARISPAIHALSGTIGRRTSSPLTDGIAKEGWQDQFNKRYKAIFPDVGAAQEALAKDAPSEMEALRFEVMRRYADVGPDSWYQTRISNSSDSTAILQEQLVTDSVKLKILYEIHQRMEENSAIQAAILAQLVNPTSKSEIEQAAQGAFRNK